MLRYRTSIYQLNGNLYLIQDGILRIFHKIIHSGQTILCIILINGCSCQLQFGFLLLLCINKGIDIGLCVLDIHCNLPVSILIQQWRITSPDHALLFPKSDRLRIAVLCLHGRNQPAGIRLLIVCTPDISAFGSIGAVFRLCPKSTLPCHVGLCTVL